MLDPAVALDRATVTDVVNSPGAGAKSGATTCGMTVYVIVSTALGLNPVATPSTLNVVTPTVLQENADVHGVDRTVGTLPSVVQYSVAPDVVDANERLTEVT